MHARWSVPRIVGLCLFIGLQFLPGRANALDPQKTIAQYGHEVWSTKNGLPEADVMAILQTRDGYLWVGTEEGLARFDGVRFTVFDRKTTPLPNNRVQALAETSDGDLWIGTENGLTRFRNGQFTNLSTRDGLPSNNIRDLWAEPDGPLWVTTVAGIRIWRHGRFERDASVDEISGNYPRQFLRTTTGETWVASDTGLKIAGRNSNSAEPMPFDGTLVRVLLEDSAKALWIGTTTGLYRRFNGRVDAYRLGGGARNPEITALLEDRNHNLWVGTLGEGLIRINREGPQHYSLGDGLSGIEVKSLYEDRAGNLWVGTFGGGLEVFRDTIFTPYGKREGVSENVVWSVMQGRDSSIWIGTQSGGLDRLKDGKVTVYSTQESFADNTVGSLFESRTGMLWLGKDSGLSRFADGRVIGAPPEDAPLHEQVHSIYEDPEGTVWIGTRTSGLVRLKDGQYTYFNSQNGLPNNNVQVVIPSRRGGLWVGTLGGLSHYRDGRFTNFTSKNGLSADQVISLYEDSEGVLWIGSDGLNRLKDGRITTYADAEGLFDQNPLAILEDNYGYLWLSTNKGIFRISKKQLNDFAEGRSKRLSPVSFGTADGMRSAECNGGSSPAGWKDRNGNLWFATVAGALKVDPRPLALNPQPLQLHIEDIWADKKYVAPASSFRLPPGGHQLEFHYSAPYFSGPARVRYRYRLDGFDKDWVDAGTRTVAYYTNLPPGDYQFQVAAGAFDATPGESEAAVSFYLTPHFYQTRWFNFAAAIAVVGLIFLIWLWTNRFMLARQNELRRLVKARTLELEAEKAELLEAKAALAEQATHDSLTGLMNRAAIFRVLEEESSKAQREKTSFAVIIADLDHFKNVNDTHGHLVGDEVLREFGRRLMNNLRPYDHAGRFGGEEFLIVMPGLPDDSGKRIRELHREISGNAFVSAGVELQVTCSIGVAWYSPQIRSTEALVNLADEALYAAKAGGRNRVEVAGELLPS